MRATLLSVMFIAFTYTVRARSVITFQLDLDPLVKEQLFSTDEGNRVFVRGSFNNWQGTSHELNRVAGRNLYTGTFDLGGKAGDTLSYKYVIEKGPGRFFWEDQPDPANPDHGNRRLVLRDSGLLLPMAHFHPNEYFSYPVIFKKEKLKADFRQFRSILEETHPAFRKAKVAEHFAVKYAMAYGFPESFTVTYQAPGKYLSDEAEIQGVNKRMVDQGKEVHNELSLKEVSQGQVALLTIHTFGYYGEVPMFKSFIDSVFQVIDQKGIDRLILDLRGNGGGDPFCSSYLWGYLQHKSVPYFEDHYGRYDTLANAIPQPANHFRGELYTLIDGLGFSTTGHFCGLLKYHQVGYFVGSETGATYTCTGNATYPALDETGIMVGTARVMRYTAAVKGMDPRRGVIPDYPVESTQEDLISGRDAVLEHALSLAAGRQP